MERRTAYLLEGDQMSEWIYGDYAEAAAAHRAGAEVQVNASPEGYGFVDNEDGSFWVGVRYRWRKPVAYREVTLKYAPMTERPKHGDRYFTPCAGCPDGHFEDTWLDIWTDENVFSRGMCFTEEAVKEYVKQHGWVK